MLFSASTTLHTRPVCPFFARRTTGPTISCREAVTVLLPRSSSRSVQILGASGEYPRTPETTPSIAKLETENEHGREGFHVTLCGKEPGVTRSRSHAFLAKTPSPNNKEEHQLQQSKNNLSLHRTGYSIRINGGVGLFCHSKFWGTSPHSVVGTRRPTCAVRGIV